MMTRAPRFGRWWPRHSLSVTTQHVFGKSPDFTVNPGTVLEKMLEIHGSRYANLSEIEATLEIVRRGRIQPVITETVALEEIEAVHERLLNREVSGRVVAEF